MAEAVVCRACGAKLKSGRRKCLRCGQVLETPSESSRQPILGRLRLQQGPALIGGTLLSLLALLALVARSVGGGAQAPAATPAAAPRPPVAEVAKESVRATPNLQFLNSKHGGTVAYAEGNYDTAAARYQKAIEIDPNDADALNNLGQVLARTGKAQEAIQYFERAIKLYPKVWAYRFNLAHTYGQMGDWAGAVTEYRAAQELFPDDYATQFNLASALHKQGREDEAVAGYQKAIVLAPSEPSFHLSLGVSYERLSRPNDAVAAYRRYLELAPDAPDAKRVQDHIQALTESVTATRGTSRPPPAKQG